MAFKIGQRVKISYLFPYRQELQNGNGIVRETSADVYYGIEILNPKNFEGHNLNHLIENNNGYRIEEKYLKPYKPKSKRIFTIKIKR